MNHRGAFFCLDEDKIKLQHKKSKQDLFEKTWKVRLVDRQFSVANKLNVIGISPALFAQLSSQKMLLVNLESGKYSNVSFKLDEKVGDAEFVATAHLKETLALEGSEAVFLCQYKDLKFSRVLVQKIDHIRESNLVIAESDYQNLGYNIQESPYRFFEVYNTFSHDSIVVEKNHIIPDASLAQGTVRLSKRQRSYLGLEVPQYLSNEQWAVLEEKLDPESEEHKIICEVYPSEDRVLDKSVSYEKKNRAKEIVSGYCSGELSMIPVPESTYAKKRGLLRRICDVYVGKSTLSLVCRRPYDIDEGVDVVRITKSNMNLLGIDEMDKVILQYKNKKVSCRVLELDDEEAFAETNFPISKDLVVGVPVHIRKKLQVMDLSSSIKVDRDTTFIFKKSINEQIVPVIVTLFSTTELFKDASVAFSGLLSLIAIPLVLYLNLSSKRNMRT